jgi:hypothetical protein
MRKDFELKNDLNISFQQVNINGTKLAIGKIKNTINLSEDQTNALNSIKEWLYREIKQSDDCFYSLTGSAGTGKTTLLAKIIDELQGKFKGKTCVSAPTHKAKKVVTNKTGCNESETVQGLLGLKPDTDLEGFDVNNPIFAAISQKKIAGFKLVIMDESSMINNDLCATIKEDAIKYGVKILFVGDLLQLPPIKEKTSQCLIFPVNKYELTEVIRQNNTNPLLIVLNLLRNDIINGTEEYSKYLSENPIAMNNIEGYKCLSAVEFGAAITESFKSISYQEDRNYCRYIAWENDSIKGANRYIRKQIYNTSNPITEGELLLGYRTVVDVDYNVITLNSEDYIVKRWSTDSSTNDIKIIYATICALDDESGNNFTIKIVCPNDVEDNQNYTRYLEERNPLLSNASKRKGRFWRYYWEFRNTHFLLENIMRDNGNGLKPSLEDKKDLDYGYGITIHKSQGSTYHTVFVDMKNINNIIKYAENAANKGYGSIEKVIQAKLDCKKLLYVALSRASNKVYINI